MRQDLSDHVSVSLASPAFDIACSSEFTAPFSPSAFSNYGWDPQLFLLWIFLVAHEFKPTTQILTFLLKPDTCIQFPFVGSMISLHSTGLRQNSWSRGWHHHCSHHQPLTIPKLSRWSFLSSSCTLSQGDILHDARMCQELCEVLEGDEQSDMVPDLKSLHSNRGAIQGRKCWVPQEQQPRKAAWQRAAATSPAGEEFHRPWRDKDIMRKGSQESNWLKCTWNDDSVCWFMAMAGGSIGETWLRSTVWVGHRRANHCPLLSCLPILWS